MTFHPVAGQQRVVFLKPLVRNPNIEVGDYSYYDNPGDPLAFERDAVLYGYGPERLIIGRYCRLRLACASCSRERTMPIWGLRPFCLASSARRGLNGRWTW
jgi:hypothetical protein